MQAHAHFYTKTHVLTRHVGKIVEFLYFGCGKKLRRINNLLGVLHTENRKSWFAEKMGTENV